MKLITKEHEEKLQTLINSIKAGDDSALEEFYELEREYIHDTANKFSHYWPNTDEIVEEIKDNLAARIKCCDADNINIESLKWNVDMQLFSSMSCEHNLMSKSEENGKMVIKDLNFECLYNHIHELSFYAQQGRRIYDSLVKIMQSEDVLELISSIRESSDRTEAIGKLTENFHTSRMLAEYLYDLPTEELQTLSIDNLKNKQSYYRKAEECLAMLTAMYNTIEQYV